MWKENKDILVLTIASWINYFYFLIFQFASFLNGTYFKQ